MIVQSQLTISFDPPFYKLIFERRTAQQYAVAQVTWGTSSPKLPLLNQWLNQNFAQLQFFEQPAEKVQQASQINPKRRQRLAQKVVKTGVVLKLRLL